MFLNVILVILGFVLLIKGADWLVDGSSSLAHKFNIPTIVIGLTIVAIGTSMPELVVSTSSSIKGYSDIAIGNVVGSNLVNLLFILGICSIIKPLLFKKSTRLIDNNINIFATVFMLILCNTGLMVNRVEGIILLVCSALFIIYNIVMAKLSIDDNRKSTKKISLLKAIILIIIGIVALKFGGDFVVDNCVIIAQNMGISEKLISITIVAISTSLPELITSVMATIKGDTDLAIGNILGSNIFNIFLIIGLSSLITPINYQNSFNIDLTILLISDVIFLLFPYIKRKDYMDRKNGILFICIYVFYMIYSICINL